MSTIGKASEVGGHSLAVFGLPADGKTTAIVEYLDENQLNPLWIVFTNAGDVPATHPNWDMAVISNWYDFEKLEKQFGKEVRIEQYDVIVIEGLHYAATMLLTDILAVAETKDPRPSYLEMGRRMAATLGNLRKHFRGLIVTLDLQRDEENKIEWAINRDLIKQIVSFFGKKWYVYSKRSKDKTKLEYFVERNATYAYNLKSSTSIGE